MGLRIRTNIASLNIQRRHSGTNGEPGADTPLPAFNHQINGCSDNVAELTSFEELQRDIQTTLGPLQNRLMATMKKLSDQPEALSQDKSRESADDFAAVTAEFAQRHIVAQTGNSVAKPAIALPEVALSLLR